MGFSLLCSHELPQKVDIKKYMSSFVRIVAKISVHDRLVCFADFVRMNVLGVIFLLPLPNCYFRNCIPTLFAAFLIFFYHQRHLQFPVSQIPTSQLPHISQLGRYLTQNRNCGSPKNLCKCIKSPSTLSTSSSGELNFYLSWSNQLVTYFRLQTNAGGFWEH